MITARTLSIAICGAATLALSVPAQAQDEWPSPEDMAGAFKAICLDNAGDHKAQAKVATSSPWNMQKSKDSDDRRVYYDKFPWQVSLTTTESGINICAVTTGTPGDTTDAQSRTAATRVLGQRPADITPEDDGFSWTYKKDGREYLVLFQMQTFDNPEGPLKVVSYGLSW